MWAISWREEEVRSAGQARLMMLAEDAVLDQLGSPLLVLDEGICVLLLKRQVPREPSAVRDELLKVFGPAPLWLVHGAVYDSFEGLAEALTRTVRSAERARREEDERYVMEVDGWGLDSLLENPKLSEGLAAFAESTLAPLTAYDTEAGSQLTETLCRALTSRSLEEAAESLFVHTNTVRYRVRRAEQLLGRELGSPKEKAALTLAAFIWSRG